jgi:REP element-mobilizing transposase RayT
MPSKNSERIDTAETFYHVYNRGVNKQLIFRDKRDYAVFFSLLKRYLGDDTQTDQSGRKYPNYSQEVELLAVCLMPNHYHLLFYQIEQGALSKLMSSISTAYVAYFNKRYSRVGHLFQGRFKASRIIDDKYLLHISRYIHLNPKQDDWEYTSLPYFMGKQQAEWIKPQRILGMFDGLEDYKQFLSDYKAYKDSLDQIEQNAEIL